MSRQITGTKGNDLLVGTRKDDRITGGDGNDWILAGRGNDTADGDAGSDRLLMGQGNDTAIYNMSENRGAHDVYDGGAGKDTLVLELTRAQWLTAAVQNDIDHFLDTLNGCGGYGGRDFNFTAFDLKARNFEALKIIVDGVELSAKDDAVDARNDTASVAANKAVTIDVLHNDSVPDLVKKVEQVSGPKAGALSLNADGTFTFDTKGAFDSLGAGKTATVTFTYRVTDADGDSDTATATITVTGVGGGGANQPPVVTGAISTGSATEIADHAVGENTATHTATGTVSFTDANLSDSHTVSVTANGSDYRGTLTASVTNIATGDGAGVVTWNYSAGDAALDSLAAGQTLTQGYTVTINDGHGGSAAQTVTITLVGTNDAPTITSAVQAGSVTEIADHAAGENATTLSATGAVTFADVDLIDTHSASFQAQGNGYLGTFSLNPVNQAGDSVGWNFSVADSAVDSLAAGQTLSQSYVVTVDDGHGGTVSQTVTVTIAGSNDAPTITSAAQAGSVSEIADGAPGEGQTELAATGAVTFADVDLIDTHGASVVPQGNGYLGTFSLDPVNQAGDSVAWHFSVADSALDSLAFGQTLTQSYDVTVNDGHGGTAGQTVTVTITGTNDQLMITSAAQAGSITELADHAPGEGNTTLGDSGTITFADVDVTDTHGASFAAQGSGYLGTFSLGAVDQAGHAVGWSFSVSDFALDSLADGQTLTQSYVVTLDDGHAATATQTVTVTINGSNDAPTITSATTTGAVVEIPDGTAGENATTHVTGGAINFADIDTIDTHGASFAAQGSDYLGTFSLDPVDQAGHSLGWHFSVADSALDSLRGDQTLTQSYLVTIDDGHGGTVADTVTVTIQGTNDAPVAVADAATGDQAQILTIDVLANDLDPDAGDSHTLFAVGVPSGKGTVSVHDNHLVFDPGTDFLHLAQGASEVVTATYSMDDGAGATSSSTVDITVVGANDAPAAVADVASGGPTDILTIDVLANDLDADDGHVLSLVSAGVPDHAGHVSVVDNKLVFDPGDDFLDLGADPRDVLITYTMQDEFGATSSSIVTLTLAGSNNAPIVDDVFATGNEDGPIPLPFTSAFDNDPGDTLTYSFVPDGQHHGTLVSNGDGSYLYTPDANFSGEDSFIYTATDSHGAVGSGMLVFTVNAVADVPDLSVGDGEVSGNAGAPIALDIAAALTDTDGSEVLQLQVTGVPDGWSLSAGVLDTNTGTWTVPGGGIAGLSVTAPSGTDGSAILSVKAMATEQSNGSTAQSDAQTISVAVASDDMFAANQAAGFSMPAGDTPTDPDAAIIPYEGNPFDNLLTDHPHTMDFL
jgi:VCBS repeat-containing protein